MTLHLANRSLKFLIKRSDMQPDMQPVPLPTSFNDDYLKTVPPRPINQMKHR